MSTIPTVGSSGEGRGVEGRDGEMGKNGTFMDSP